MNHLFVPYEIALKLKEKGFDGPVFGYWYIDNITGIGSPNEPDFNLTPIIGEEGFEEVEIINQNQYEAHVSAPLYQQVVDWFREKHNWNIEIGYRHAYKDFLSTLYPMQPNTQVHSLGRFKSYYEALNKAVEEALKLIP